MSTDYAQKSLRSLLYTLELHIEMYNICISGKMLSLPPHRLFPHHFTVMRYAGVLRFCFSCSPSSTD